MPKLYVTGHDFGSVRKRYSGMCHFCGHEAEVTATRNPQQRGSPPELRLFVSSGRLVPAQGAGSQSENTPAPCPLFRSAGPGKPGMEPAAGPRWPGGARTGLCPSRDQTHSGAGGRERTRVEQSEPISSNLTRISKEPSEPPFMTHTHVSSSSQSRWKPRQKTATGPSGCPGEWAQPWALRHLKHSPTAGEGSRHSHHL